MEIIDISLALSACERIKKDKEKSKWDTKTKVKRSPEDFSLIFKDACAVVREEKANESLRDH